MNLHFTSFFTSSYALLCTLFIASLYILSYISSCLLLDTSHLSQLLSASRISYNAKSYMIINDLFRMFDIKKQLSQTRIIIYFKFIIIIIEISKKNAQKLNIFVIKLFASFSSLSRARISQLRVTFIFLKMAFSKSIFKISHICRRCSQIFFSNNQLHFYFRDAHNAFKRRCRKAQNIKESTVRSLRIMLS